MRRLSNHVLMMGIGRYLRKVRENKGYTLKEIAEAADTIDVSLCRYEHGDRIPDAIQLYLICQALGVTVKKVYENIYDSV